MAAEDTNPSFLEVHPNRRFLYSVNEISRYNGQSSGSLSAFSIDEKTGELKLLSRVASRGAGPCHLAVDKSGKCVIAAHYEGGSAAVFPILENGALSDASDFVAHSGSSVNQQRQRGPHPHQAVISPDGRSVLIPDLGLDEIVIYRLDPLHGRLLKEDRRFVKVRPGSGPRHLAFHPNGRYAYALCELDGSVTAFRYSSTGAFNAFQTVSTLPDDFKGASTSAEIEVHPTGRFLYTSNRGPDTIAVFHITPATCELTPVDHVSTQSKTPRHFAIDPGGNFLFVANQDSDTIVSFQIDQKKGTLAPTGPVVECAAPVCITFAAARR